MADLISEGDGDDLLDQVRVGQCPRCGAQLQQPEITYDAKGVPHIEGSGYDWCAACGWDEEDDAAADDDEIEGDLSDG